MKSMKLLFKKLFIVPKINKALNIKLKKWQIEYIFNKNMYVQPGRATGKTLAHVLKLLFNRKEITLYRNRPFEEIDELIDSNYDRWFKNYLWDIYNTLKNKTNLKIAKVSYARFDNHLFMP